MKFPREQLYGLTSQIRRYAVSVRANVAEGCRKTENTELQCCVGLGKWVGLRVAARQRLGLL